MIKLAVAFLAIFTASTFSASAQNAVRLKGIGYDMSFDERVEAARGLGLDCFVNGDTVVFEEQVSTVKLLLSGIDRKDFECYMQNSYTLRDISNIDQRRDLQIIGDFVIQFRPIPSYTATIFTCQILNACNVTIDELAQSIVDSGIVQNYGLSPPDGAFMRDHRCGRAAAGELVCIYSAFASGTNNLRSGPHVWLFLGSFGSGPISLD